MTGPQRSIYPVAKSMRALHLALSIEWEEDPPGLMSACGWNRSGSPLVEPVGKCRTSLSMPVVRSWATFLDVHIPGT